MGKITDILAVLSVVFGLAGSLAMGILAVRSGTLYAFGAPETTTSSIILGVLFVCYMLSATTGVDKGIKILSNLTMVIAIGVMLFVNLERKGTPIGVNGLHIAGHARSEGLTLVTNNLK